jgi:predicted porin
VKKALFCAAAISSIASAAYADELSDLKAQSDQLKQQNQLLISRIEALEARENKLEAQPLPPQTAAPAPTGPDNGPLTWHGITISGSIDLGAAYQTAGTPLNGNYGPGLEYLITKNSNKGQFSFAPNALSYSSLGVKGTEEIFDGLSAVFNVQSTFVPTSGQLSNGQQSLVDQNGVPLNKQVSGGDSSRAGQPFNGAAYIGLSSPTFGTLTVGRQNALTLDGVIAYDPMGASNAFSLIGYSGTVAGMGDTEDARLDNSLKYLVNLGPVRAATLVQIPGNSNITNGGAYEFDLGTDFEGLSVDAVYSQKYDAISAATLAAPAAGTQEQLAATISDNTTYMFLARYELDAFKFYGGYEHLQFDNPQNPLGSPVKGVSTVPIPDLGGYTIAAGQGTNNAFTNQKVLEYWWTGLKYALTPELDLAGAYYHEWQNDFLDKTCPSTGTAPANTINKACAGDLDAFSLLADYKFTKRLDVYGGFMYSVVDGGLSSGFLHDSTIDPTVGARFRF